MYSSRHGLLSKDVGGTGDRDDFPLSALQSLLNFVPYAPAIYSKIKYIMKYIDLNYIKSGRENKGATMKFDNTKLATMRLSLFLTLPLHVFCTPFSMNTIIDFFNDLKSCKLLNHQRKQYFLGHCYISL